jgi:hypothetical protein
MIIKKCIDNTSEYSHKRFVAVFSFILLIALAFLSAFGYNANSSYVWTFGALTGGESILTVIEKLKS